jgi:hypothetical protein
MEVRGLVATGLLIVALIFFVIAISNIEITTTDKLPKSPEQVEHKNCLGTVKSDRELHKITIKNNINENITTYFVSSEREGMLWIGFLLPPTKPYINNKPERLQ